MNFSEAERGVSTSSLRTASETRRLALKLQSRLIPFLAKKHFETRWNVGPDSVRKTLRLHGVDPGPEKDNLIPLTSGLLCEGVEDTFMAWFVAKEEELAVLKADLLTEDECRAQAVEIWTDRGTLRRDLPPVIRIGRLKRYRPDPETAARARIAWLGTGG